MIFALLFIAAFIVGFIIYHFDRRWQSAVIIPTAFYVLSVIIDQATFDAKVFSLIFGVPILFFASLLGAYVYQQRLGSSDS